jgi:predicted transposase/invertase (TIGR01784 family)
VEDEFKMLAMKDPMINEAYCKLQVMSDDEATRMLYQARLKAQRDEYARVQGARQDGEQNKAIEIARNLKKIGIPVEQIAQGTGLSVEDIANL